jgi:hypothetical protein
VPVVATERLRSLATAVLVVAPFAVGWGVGTDDEVPRGEVVTTFVDPEIVESSGLVATRERVITTNDSGDAGRVFVVDPTNGRTVGVTRWAESPTDVEALAPAGEDAVWVADIGDNTGSRDSVEVALVPVQDRDVTVEVRPTTLTYRGPARDAEALVAHPRTGRLFVLTKGVLAGEAWAVPRDIEPGAAYRMRRVGRLPGMVTDAAFLPDGRHVLVRTYSRAILLAFPSWEVQASWRLPDQPQGEGLAITPDGRILLSSEGVREPLLRVRPPAEVRALLSGRTDAVVEPPTAPRGEVVSDVVTEGRDRDTLQWWIGGALAVAALLVLVRAVRPR